MLRTVISLGVWSPTPSSSLPAVSLSKRTVSHRLFGLAPAGVCRAIRVATNAVGSYPTVSPLPARTQAVYSLWHYPSPEGAQALPGSVSKEPGLSSIRRSIFRVATVRPREFLPLNNSAFDRVPHQLRLQMTRYQKTHS
jgi:hypothetical protein